MPSDAQSTGGYDLPTRKQLAKVKQILTQLAQAKPTPDNQDNLGRYGNNDRGIYQPRTKYRNS